MDNNERKYRLVESYRDNASKKEFYSMQRIDLIIVSLSAGGIIAILSNLEELLKINSSCLPIFLFLSLILLLVAVLSNIASQVSAQKAFQKVQEWASNELNIRNSENPDEENLIETPDLLDKITGFFNKISLFSVMIGLSMAILSIGICIL